MRSGPSLLGDDGSASVIGCAVMAGLIAITATLLHPRRSSSDVIVRIGGRPGGGGGRSALDRGVVEACEASEVITTRMRVRLRRCEIDEWDALVEVTAAVSALFGGKEATPSASRSCPMRPSAGRSRPYPADSRSLLTCAYYV